MKRALLVLTTLIVTSIGSIAVPAENDAIIAAAGAYVRQNSAVQKPHIIVEAVEGNYARAKLVPQRGETDVAIIFLKKTNGAWRGLTLGTAFGPDDYKQLGIPPHLRVQ